MKTKNVIPFIFFAFALNLYGCAQEKVIKLPEPQKTGGMPLMDAL